MTDTVRPTTAEMCRVNRVWSWVYRQAPDETQHALADLTADELAEMLLAADSLVRWIGVEEMRRLAAALLTPDAEVTR